MSNKKYKVLLQGGHSIDVVIDVEDGATPTDVLHTIRSQAIGKDMNKLVGVGPSLAVMQWAIIGIAEE